MSSTGYSVLVTPTANGVVTIDMPTQAGVDPSGNDSNAAIQLSIMYDIVSPSIVLSTPLSTVTGSFNVRATFSEPVT